MTGFYCVICNADPFATTFWWYIIISQNVRWKGLDIDGCVQGDGDSKDLRCWHQRFKTTLNDCQFAWTHTHMHVHTYTHVRTHARTHTHAHTHTHTQSLFLSVKFYKFPSLLWLLLLLASSNENVVSVLHKAFKLCGILISNLSTLSLVCWFSFPYAEL